MPIEHCQKCFRTSTTGNQIVADCVPVPFFGKLTGKNLKAVTIGLNPALNEFYHNGIELNRSKRLALLVDYSAAARENLTDSDVSDAKFRREQ